MTSDRPSLRREVLGSFGILFSGGILLACLGLLVVYPVLDTPGQAVFYLLALLVGDLVVLFVFGRRLLETQLVEPVDRLVADTERIAGGEYHHRVELAETAELRAVGESVNLLSDRLIREQKRLAENVASLVETNRELVEARNEVTRTARLASAGTLAAGIAHEVGNPLSAIVAYADVARNRAASSGDVDPELLDAIREEAARIDRIVRGLLDYARPDGGEGEEADPFEVVERVRELLEQQGRLGSVTVTWEQGEEKKVPRVTMDPHRLEHVLLNLLLNSIDALEGEADPRIRITAHVEQGGSYRMPTRRAGDPPGVNYVHRRRVAADKEGMEADPLWTASRVVALVVEDNGPGIPESDLERIFDPFFTTKDPGKGTGLGLAICARLVEGIGGRIDVENRREGGARFIIRVAAARPRE